MNSKRINFLWGAAIAFVLGIAVFGFSIPDNNIFPISAKSRDFWEGMRSVGGWPWWTPNYLGGTSLAPVWGFMIVNIWLLLWTSMLGMSAGSLVALLLCLPVAAATSFWFMRAWTKSSAAAAVGSFLYILSPSLWMRIVAVEHLVVVAAMAVLPLTFLGVLKMIRSPDGRSASYAGAGLAMLALTYSKAAILALPFLALFWLALTMQNKTLRQQWRSPVRTGFLASSFFLGVVPLLPSVRESSFFIFFAHGPFLGWQNAFSLKSAMQLLDRLGELSAGYTAGFVATTGAGGFYLGSLALAIMLFAWLLWYASPESLGAEKFLEEEGFRPVVRLGAVMVLLGLWLAAGPNNIFSAHVVALGASVTGRDSTVVLLWGMLLLSAWLVWVLAPGRGLRREILAVLLLVVFLFVPGFRALEFFPFYNNIRAPFDFFQVPAPLFVATLAGIFSVVLWRSNWGWITRIALLVLGIVLLVWDAAGLFRLQKENRLAPGTWESFEKVQTFVRDAPEPGAVMPFSGRYFYLLTPQMSGRPLIMEAFQSYLQQRDFALLLAQAQMKEEFFDLGLRLAGAAFLLYDQGGHPPGDDLSLPGGLTPVFTSGEFSVGEIPHPLFPGFVAESALEVEEWTDQSYEAALIAGRMRLVPLEGFSLVPESPEFSGVLRGGDLQLTTESERDGGQVWQTMPPVQWQQNSFQQWTFRFPEEARGWLILTQAWHPDWRAVSPAHGELVVGRAFGSLPAFRVQPGDEVVFRYDPPFWYGLAAWASTLAWSGFFLYWLGSCLLSSSRRDGFRRWRERRRASSRMSTATSSAS